MLRKGLMILAISALLGATMPASVASAGPSGDAGATSYGQFTNYGRVDGTGIHLKPTSASPWLTLITPANPVTDFCYKTGETLNGTAYWDVVYHPQQKLAGWTNEWYLTSKAQTLWCDDSAAMESYYGHNFAQYDNIAGLHSCTNNTCQVLTMLGAQVEAFELCYSTGATLGTGNDRWSLLYYRVPGTSTVHVGWTHQNWLRLPGTTWHC
ncbi:hypothetical protein [Micromonospora eburnea]|uniref:Uncharacterized protein n=1 Tax=Micromonospora eburnea TaxID=227316 RepID=A0A1C6U8J4_9ACTN|nr:hypothetical protein [Micromonospora eburnea]SCL50231.1 hypothetical protein GA0070604_2081 [Micromonospora eburnea]